MEIFNFPSSRTFYHELAVLADKESVKEGGGQVGPDWLEEWVLCPLVHWQFDLYTHPVSSESMETFVHHGHITKLIVHLN